MFFMFYYKISLVKSTYSVSKNMSRYFRDTLYLSVLYQWKIVFRIDKKLNLYVLHMIEFYGFFLLILSSFLPFIFS